MGSVRRKNLMSIRRDIEHWDGKSAKDIGEIYHRYCMDTSFTSNIIELIGKSPTQKGATWLLKHSLENDKKIGESEVNKIFKNLNRLSHWESKLHLLQSLPFLIITEPNKKKVELFLRNCLMENNKFVRAWAYNGFYELSVQYPEYENETREFFEMAMRDEAPSVISRIRNIMKKGF
jgi:hypothetical protein